MKPQAHDFLVRLCAERAGLRLAAAAPMDIEARLAPVARREGFSGVDDLLAAVNGRNLDRLGWKVVEAMAPAPAEFFREPAVFAHLCELATAHARSGRRLKVWVAGCGAGQEVYSLAMALDERPDRPEVEIFASDLSAMRLEKAQAGAYTAYEVQRGLSARRLVRCFEKRDDAYLISPRLRSMVCWSRVNLVEDISRLGGFDVILCRQVLPLLTEAARERVSAAMAGALAPKGRLILDAGEYPAGWQPVPGPPGIFRPERPGRQAA